jgi:nicotinic acid mononucleotide adenylyltransferase
MRPVDVSSSAVREQIAAGASPDGMIAPEVAGYISDQHLYMEART